MDPRALVLLGFDHGVQGSGRGCTWPYNGRGEAMYFGVLEEPERGEGFGGRVVVIWSGTAAGQWSVVSAVG